MILLFILNLEIVLFFLIIILRFLCFMMKGNEVKGEVEGELCKNMRFKLEL